MIPMFWMRRRESAETNKDKKRKKVTTSPRLSPTLGARCVLPSSTKGRKGMTTARMRRPDPGRSMARSCARSVKGVSHRSNTLRSAMPSSRVGYNTVRINLRLKRGARYYCLTTS